MEAKIYISGRIEKGVTLKDVIRQYKSFDEPESAFVEIESNGGNEKEGEAVYNYLKGIDKDIPVTTYAKKAYSVAAKIFTAGREREVEDIEKALMIHFASVKVEGNASKLEAYAEYMRELEEKFANYYSGFLNIDIEACRELLDNDTYISGKEAVEMGFATKLREPIEAVAELSINQNDNIMNRDQKTGRELLKKMAEYLGIKNEANAEMILQDASGQDIVFAELEEGDIPKVGDAGTIDGASVPDGKYIMPSMEDQTFVFEGGKIVEILPKEEEPEQDTEPIAEDPKPEPIAEEIQQVSVWTTEVLNTSFAVGDTVKYKDWEGNEAIIGSGEFQLLDGRRVVTDATGVIVFVKEATNDNGVSIEPEASFEELMDKVTQKVTETIEARYKETIEAKDEEIKGLLSKIGSKEVTAESRENQNEEPKKEVKNSVFYTRKKSNQ